MTPETVLGAFGGAGPFSICAVAEAVNAKRIIVPSMAAVFSASGIGESDIGHRYDDLLTGPDSPEAAQARIAALLARARQDMFAEGFALDDCTLTWTLTSGDAPAQKITGDEVVTTLSNLAPGSSVLELVASYSLGHNHRTNGTTGSEPIKPRGKRTVRFSGGKDDTVPLYLVDDLRSGMTASGPAIIEDAYFTLPVLPGWTFAVTPAGDIELTYR